VSDAKRCQAKVKPRGLNRLGTEVYWPASGEQFWPKVACFITLSESDWNKASTAAKLLYDNLSGGNVCFREIMVPTPTA